MLVLTRKSGQSIKIGEEVEVRVLAIDGDQVKLGIEAPRRIDVNRSEIYDAIRDANSQAAAADLTDDVLTAMKAIKKTKNGNGTSVRRIGHNRE